MFLSNAPVSWGIFNAENPRVTPDQYLDEVAATGYVGTELGPYGFLPTDPAVLRDALAKRGLRLVGGVHVHGFSDPASAAEFYRSLRRAGTLLQALGVDQYVVMDGGKAGPDHSLTAEEWLGMTRMLGEGSKLLSGEFGVTLTFHPHVATAVEFEDQIDRLLHDTDIGLCFDTGHHAFWDQDALAYMHKVWDRIGYMHLKNVDAAVRRRVLDGELDPRQSFHEGVMCPLPDGVVDIPAVVAFLKDRDFAGPVVVEQDFAETSAESPAELSARNADFLGPLL